MNHTYARALVVGLALGAAVLIGTAPAGAQNAAKAAPKADAKAKATPQPAGGQGGAYPQRPRAAADILQRGETLFKAQCGFCHGEDARGGDMGSNLIRSSVVLNDDNGEHLAPVLREGVEGSMMPKFSLDEQQTSDIAAFLHSFRVNGYDGSRNRPDTIVVGNAPDGKTFFDQKCASCHATSLRGIATRITDARTLQQRWLNPSAGGRGVETKPVTVTVTANGKRTEGKLVRIDDFLVTVESEDKKTRTFQRDGDTPKVEVRDPYQGHRDLLSILTDKNIHDVTAYLVTLK
jgi:mono/diheme cytochrome c family protein